ncbi:MAG: GNAT family N-acetyltransferase [candidate division Zixibacteria bacterium]|nr:GNAT family N-acetyltransferase [candidate division Zixibacteria bacterium]
MNNNTSIVAEDDLIYLRRVSKDDLDCFYLWYKDPEIQEPMANPNWDPDRSKDDYRPIFLHRHLLQTGSSLTLTICLKEENTAIGLVHYYDIDREAGGCNFGVIVGEKKQWRRGIATSAVKLATAHIFDTADLKNIFCNILQTNRRSIGLFKKCGFVFHEVTHDSGIEFLRYRLLRSETTSPPENRQPD